MTAGRWNAASAKFGGDGVRRCDALRFDVSYYRGKRNGSRIRSPFPYFAASRSSFRGRDHCSLTIVTSRVDPAGVCQPTGSTRLLPDMETHVREPAG